MTPEQQAAFAAMLNLGLNVAQRQVGYNAGTPIWAYEISGFDGQVVASGIVLPDGSRL